MTMMLMNNRTFAVLFVLLVFNASAAMARLQGANAPRQSNEDALPVIPRGRRRLMGSMSMLDPVMLTGAMITWNNGGLQGTAMEIMNYNFVNQVVQTQVPRVQFINPAMAPNMAMGPIAPQDAVSGRQIWIMEDEDHWTNCNYRKATLIAGPLPANGPPSVMILAQRKYYLAGSYPECMANAKMILQRCPAGANNIPC